MMLHTTHISLRSLSEEGFRHDRGVVVGNLPFTIFKSINVGVSGLDLVTSGSHGEFVNTGIHDHVVSLDDIGFQNDTLRLGR